MFSHSPQCAKQEKHKKAQSQKDQQAWQKRCLLNICKMGMFSSDRSISEYADKIWKAKPVRVDMRATHGFEQAAQDLESNVNNN